MLSGRIPDEVIAEVLKQHDIVEIVGKYVHLSKHGRNWIGLCPFHSEKTPSFNVSAEKQIYRCFGCGAGGSVIKFVMEVEGLSFPEAVRELAEDANIVHDWSSAPQEETEEQKERGRMIEGHELAAKIYHYVLKNTSEGNKAMQYLRDRGFTDKWIDDFQIGYAPIGWDTLVRYLTKNNFELPLMEKGGLIAARSEGNGYIDRFRDRVMFPIHDPKGRVLAFSGRSIGDAQPKYMNSPETPLFNKSRTLFNLHRARPAIRKSGVIVLFEGHVDVVRAYETGVNHGVATMGTALTEYHAKLVRRLAEHVVICYDGDQAGQAAASKTMDLLQREGCQVRVALLPDRMDPDDYIGKHGGDAFRSQIIDGAVSATKYRLIYLRKGFPLHTDDGKLQYIQAALRIIAGLTAPTEREYYLKELSIEFQFSIEALNEQLHQIRAQAQKNNHQRDNNEISWNNVMQSESGMQGVPALKPAYHNAERKLLSVMLEDRDVALYVQEHLADQFNVDAHAAIAAYLYAYYSQGNDPDPSRFIAQLHDDKLSAIVSALSFSEAVGGNQLQVIDDYMKEIRNYPKLEALRQINEEQKHAVRSGDKQRAAQLGMEIISLKKELKSI
jgi:DNA primase